MAAFIVKRSELLKYPALEHDLSDMCIEIVSTREELHFTPRLGALATVGFVLLHNRITYNLELDACAPQEVKGTSFETSLSNEIVNKKQRSRESAHGNRAYVVHAHPGAV